MSFTFISIILNNSKSVKTCNFVSIYVDIRIIEGQVSVINKISV